MFSKNKAFVGFSIFFIGGILINNILFNIYLSILVLLFIVILFLNFHIYNKKYLYMIIFCIFGFFSGILISANNINTIQNNSYTIESYFNNNKYDLKLEVIDIYKQKEYENQYLVKTISINGKNNFSDKNIKAIITISGKYILEKGSIISTKSKIDEISDFSDFSYKNFLLSKDIYFTSYVYNYEKLEVKKLPKIVIFIDKLRNRFLEITNEIYPKEEGIFLAGILIGAKQNLPDDLKTDFNNSGLSHLIAVSGFNITIIIIFLSYLFAYFPIYLRVFLTISSIVFFTFLVGDTAPVLRASIMGVLAYLIMVSGRKADVFSVILFSSLIMLIFSPFILNYDVSFQLSFLAVLGVVYLSDFFKKIFYFMPEFLAIKESFVLTMSALVMTLPIILFNFGQLSIVAPVTNILVSWTIPLAMFFGFFSILLYLLNPIFGLVLGYITWVFLKFDILIVHFFGQLDFAVLKIDLGDFKSRIEILYFVVIFFLIVYFKEDNKRVK